MKKRFQSYRGTWAWLTQRCSAIGLFLLIPMKIYTGGAARDKVPFPEILGSSKRIHFNSAIDIALLLFFLVHIGMVWFAGFRSRTRTMITGRMDGPLEDA